MGGGGGFVGTGAFIGAFIQAGGSIAAMPAVASTSTPFFGWIATESALHCSQNERGDRAAFSRRHCRQQSCNEASWLLLHGGAVVSMSGALGQSSCQLHVFFFFFFMGSGSPQMSNSFCLISAALGQASCLLLLHGEQEPKTWAFALIINKRLNHREDIHVYRLLEFVRCAER